MEDVVGLWGAVDPDPKRESYYEGKTHHHDPVKIGFLLFLQTGEFKSPACWAGQALWGVAIPWVHGFSVPQGGVNIFVFRRRRFLKRAVSLLYTFSPTRSPRFVCTKPSRLFCLPQRNNSQVQPRVDCTGCPRFIPVRPRNRNFTAPRIILFFLHTGIPKTDSLACLIIAPSRNHPHRIGWDLLSIFPINPKKYLPRSPSRPNPGPPELIKLYCPELSFIAQLF